MKQKNIQAPRYQIGVMGSAADLKYSKKIEAIALTVGRLIAEAGHIVVYGAEKDYDSLSTAAARGAKSAGGLTVGVTYGRGREIWDKEGNTDVVIVTGMERGGGREFVLVNSCDAIITISGGSGTLTEIAIAYQANIPITVITSASGWSKKLANQYLDERKRIRAVAALTPEAAVKKTLAMLKGIR